MSQHDPQAQQGISPVKSFALQFDSDSEAGSVYSNGIDSPPLERRAEERDKDSARRATLAALGLVPGPPPPVSGTQVKLNKAAVTPGNHFLAQQSSPPISAEASPEHSASRKSPGYESPPKGLVKGSQSPSQAPAAVQPGSVTRGGFGVSPFSKVSENIAGQDKPRATHSPESSQERLNMGTGAPLQHGKQTEGFREGHSVEDKPLAAKALSGQSLAKPHGSSETDVGGLARVPSSPFEAAQSMPIEEQPFVSPVPPIKTKAPTSSPQSSTSRQSLRFTDRFTSPTTTRIVDELLDEVVAHRLTPRDTSGSGRNNEPPMRPRGRSNSGDERDLPRIGKQEKNDGSTRKDFSSFSDAGHALPSASGGSSRSDPETRSSKGSAGPQSLSPGREGRSSSIGDELKMVMKSERAGRLARDSAEILVGDRPGEFTVVTQEGSSIPVDVRDLTESTSGKKEPLLEAASKPGQLQPATAQAFTAAGPTVASAASGQPPSALTQSSAVTSATDASDAAQQKPDQSSAAKKSSTWLGSMMAAGTAAFGLKGGAPADTGSTRLLQTAAQPGAAHAPASAGASSSAAFAAGASAPGAGHHLQQPPILDIAATEPKAEPPAVSAFASEVAVQPVSAATTDSSPIEGFAAHSASAVVSPPVEDVNAPEAEEYNAFADSVSLECVQKESSLAGKPLEKSHVSQCGTPPSSHRQHTGAMGDPSTAFQESLGLEELHHSRKQPDPTSPILTASSTASDMSTESAGFLGGRNRRRANRSSTEFIDEGFEGASGLVPDPSHRTSIDFTGPVPSSAVGSAIGEMRAKPGRGPNLPILPEPVDEPLLDPVESPMAGAAGSTGLGRPLTDERSRSEAAFLEAMPLEMPQKMKPAAVSQPAAPPRTTSDMAAPDDALPLEKLRPQSTPLRAIQPQAAAEQQAPSWDQAVPLEMTRRKASPKQMASQPEKGDVQAALAWEEAAPLERSQKRSSSRSTPSASPRKIQPHSPSAAADPKSRHSSSRRSRQVDITEEAQLQDPSLDANAALDQRLPLMANLSGNYSLESSGTERYDLYIDRAAAYDKAQQTARHTAHPANKPAPTKQAALGSLDSAAATVMATARRVPHMGGIAASTQPGALPGHHEEPDIDMPEPSTPASEDSDSDEAEGNSIYFPSKARGGEKGQDDASMKELVGVSQVAPPPSAFASAQPPRSVFADAQMPASDSEADPDSARSRRASTDAPAHPKAAQVDDTNNIADTKARGKQKPVKKKGFCSCFG